VNQKSATHLEDKLLVERILQGETPAFGILIKRTEGLVAQIVFKMVSNTEDRKDLAQDVYLKAFKNLGGFQFQAKISTWVGQIAYNTCLNYLEKKKLVLVENYHYEDAASDDFTENNPLRFFSPTDDWSEPRLSKKETQAILTKEVDALPPLYRTLISLCHYEELSYEEMALITNLPVGTVKSYLFRARKTLKESLLSKYKKEEL
jgi:RNA polymerase sigma factor (sigma-70 family)